MLPHQHQQHQQRRRHRQQKHLTGKRAISRYQLIASACERAEIA